MMSNSASSLAQNRGATIAMSHLALGSGPGGQTRTACYMLRVPSEVLSAPREDHVDRRVTQLARPKGAHRSRTHSVPFSDFAGRPTRLSEVN